MFLLWVLLTVIMAGATAVYIVNAGFNKTATFLMLGGAIAGAALFTLMVGL